METRVRERERENDRMEGVGSVSGEGGGGGGVKKSGTFGWWGHFLFFLPFDAEAIKTCKNTIKLINLCALPCLGLGLWLTLTVYFDLA